MQHFEQNMLRNKKCMKILSSKMGNIFKPECMYLVSKRRVSSKCTRNPRSFDQMPAVMSVLLVIFLTDLWPWPCACVCMSDLFSGWEAIAEFNRIYAPISKGVCVPFSIILHILIRDWKIICFWKLIALVTLKSYWKRLG